MLALPVRVSLRGLPLTVNEANHRCHAAETLRGSALQKIRLTRVEYTA